MPEYQAKPLQTGPVADGVVLGIDVGCSPTRPSTCFCTLAWDASTARLQFRLTTSNGDQQREALTGLVGTSLLDGVAIDGPLTNGFRLVRNYRAAEALLSRGVLQKRGKPGQTSVPVGQELHAHASRLAELVRDAVDVVPATHADAISDRRIVEAFPNLYLAALVDEAHIPVLRRNASDAYWRVLVTETDALARHLRQLLPGRTLEFDLATIRNHDHRAGVVCALTALAVVVGEYVAVGDPYDGDIVLPGEKHWGVGSTSNPWLSSVLRENLASVAGSNIGTSNHRFARVRTAAGPW